MTLRNIDCPYIVSCKEYYLYMRVNKCNLLVVTSKMPYVGLHLHLIQNIITDNQHLNRIIEFKGRILKRCLK